MGRRARQPRIHKHLAIAPGDSLNKIHAAEIYRTRKAIVQQGHQEQQADTSTPADGTAAASPSPTSSPTEPAAEEVRPLSQAQRMRRALGGPDATTQLRILKVDRPASERSTAAAAWRKSRDSTTKRVVPVSTAITVNVEEKKKLQEEQQAGTLSQSEDELRERLKKLEEQLALLQAKLAADTDAKAGNSRTAEQQPSTTPGQAEAAQNNEKPEVPANTVPTAHTTLAQQTQAPSTSRKSSSHVPPASSHQPPSPSTLPPPTSPPSTLQAPPASAEVSEQSLLDELFPEASSLVPPDLSDKRRSLPKLDLPAPDTHPRVRLYDADTRTEREKAIDAFRARGEQTTVLQLSNCSTALTESDFRRLIPRGKHIDTWSSAGEFYKIIPGRDPLSLARLPFYYLLFHSPTAALAYQKNASRLSKLAALHAPSSTASAVPPPAGFLEDGEDIAAVTSSFVLHPRGHALDLRTVMQPYNPGLRALIDAGGYTPIVPNVDDKGRKIHRVLLTIDGYEPGHWDLWQIIARHAHTRGILWPWMNDHASALRRLRDVINLKTVSKQKYQDLATSNPRAATSSPSTNPVTARDDAHAEEDREFEDPTISAFLGPSSSAKSTQSGASSTKEINQLVMNRVYNRWIAEFEDEDAARRFAGLWHRVRLPDAKDREGKWKEAEEERWVTAEYLW